MHKHYILTWIHTYVNTYIYMVSKEECARVREGVPYAKIYRYNPKPLCPNWIVYGNNGQRILKLWQLLLTYWSLNTYLNWQENLVSVMLITVRNIKFTYKWHKTIKLNYKNTRRSVIVVLRIPSTILDTSFPSRNVTVLRAFLLQNCTKIMQHFGRHAFI